MKGLMQRLRGDVALEPDVQALCREAADMIDALNSQLDTCVRTMNACIADYQRLRHVAVNGDMKAAYELGVRHAMGGQTNHGAAPAARARTDSATGEPGGGHGSGGTDKPVTRPVLGTGNTQEPVAWAVVGADGEVLDSHIYHTESIARRWADETNDCIAPLYRNPQPTLTAEEREAVKLAAEWFASVPLGDTLRALLERTK